MLALGRERIMHREFLLSEIGYRVLISDSVSIKGSKEAEYDSKTWPALHKLALKTPEAGVHLQGKVPELAGQRGKPYSLIADNVVYNREKDAQSATAQWFSGLLSSEPWFSDVVPDVRWQYGIR